MYAALVGLLQSCEENPDLSITFWVHSLWNRTTREISHEEGELFLPVV